MDKFIAKRMASMPDYRAEVAAQLPPGESVRGLNFAIPYATEGKPEDYSGDMIGGDAQSAMMNAAFNAGKGKIDEARHLSGEDGSTARSFNRSPDQRAYVLTEAGLSLWSFGLQMNETPPVEKYRLPRRDLARIEKLPGPKGPQGRGMATARLHFADGSWLDVRAMDHDMYADFWTALG